MTRIERVLLSDIGGTNARFALLNEGEIGPVERTKVADYATAADAIAAFLARHAAGDTTVAAILDFAGPVENNRAALTNSSWTIDAGDIRKLFGFRAVHLLNDFEALAWGLPALASSDLVSIGTPRPEAGAPMLVVGPGTGFGASCLMPRDAASFAIITEAGHATLPAGSEREARVIGHLRQRFGHVSIERALSGPGLENIYEGLAALRGAKRLRSRRPRAMEAALSAAPRSTCFARCWARSAETSPLPSARVAASMSGAASCRALSIIWRNRIFASALKTRADSRPIFGTFPSTSSSNRTPTSSVSRRFLIGM